MIFEASAKQTLSANAGYYAMHKDRWKSFKAVNSYPFQAFEFHLNYSVAR